MQKDKIKKKEEEKTNTIKNTSSFAIETTQIIPNHSKNNKALLGFRVLQIRQLNIFLMILKYFGDFDCKNNNFLNFDDSP